MGAFNEHLIKKTTLDIPARWVPGVMSEAVRKGRGSIFVFKTSVRFNGLSF